MSPALKRATDHTFQDETTKGHSAILLGSIKICPLNNHGLFSNHFLETQIPKTIEWKEDAGAKKAFEEISELFKQNEQALAKYKEAQLEENFIRPILKILGHFYGIQGKVEENARVPDYAFFPDQTSLNEAYILQGTQDFYKKAIAIGDAKAWDISLDKSQQSGKGMWDKQNPSYQIDTYLRDTPPVWGILTNGRQWRLYHESTSYKLDVYYEVDLPSLISSGNLDAFKYFYLFFRLEAFPKFPEDSFLDRAREGSQAYAREIGESLQENVYKAMQKLAEGFFADSSNGLTKSEEELKAVQDNSMLLLYRVLFIFYAESRGLLDTGNKFYRGMSLQEMKKEIATKIDACEFLAPFSYAYWGRLTNLFDLINEGSESNRWKIDRKVLYIPAYNGGLFDPAKNSFLSTKHISDPYLAEAIDLLARSDKAMVDYSSLDIRHLGSIYEGILEYRLTPDLELLTDRGERKVTGSYYTPDSVVKHIVENTIGPILIQKKEVWVSLLDRRKFADYILSVKILDPAMGSGHFLVEAVDYLARALVEAWATARKEDAKTKEVAEHDIQWARREVVRKCIYGVDLNPMAVELAKLALWLTTAAANKPLSFLDHHFRCGNSLIGSDLDSLKSLPDSESGNGPLQAFFARQRKKLIDGLLIKFHEIDSIPDDSLKIVKEKEQKYRELMGDELSKRIREVANVRISTYYGNEVVADDYELMMNGIDPELTREWVVVRDLDWFKRAQRIAQEIKCFHWELEFPEVFNDGGFDIVMGNPPWGAGLTKDDERYLSRKTLDDADPNRSLDTYSLFIERALELLKEGSWLGYITPDTFLRKDDHLATRDLLLKGTQISEILETGPLFSEVRDTWCSIIIVRKSAPDDSTIIKHKKISRFVVSVEDRLDKFARKAWDIETMMPQSVWLHNRDMIVGYLASEREQQIISKMECNPPLGQLKDRYIISRGEEGSKFNLKVEENGDFFMVIPEDIERHITSRGIRIASDSLTQTKVQSFYKHSKIWIIRIQKMRWRQRIVSSFDERVNSAGMKTLQIVVSPTDTISDIKFLQAILTSKLMNTWCVNYLADDMNKSYLEKMPIPTIDPTRPQSLAYYNRIVSLVDQIVDLNQQKQFEINEFLKWLEGEIGAKVEGLNGASKFQEYYNHDFSEFLAFLIKNKRKLKEGYNPSARSPKELLSTEFQSSASKLKSLTEKIDETDRQIDNLVYELYGLTGAEIKVVKGTESN